MQKTIPLINSVYNFKDALELITHLIHIKIRYHQHRLQVKEKSEVVRMRENEIRQLQRELFEVTQLIHQNDQKVTIEVTIHISKG